MAVNKALVITPETWNNDIAVDVQFYDGSTCVFEYNIELTDTTQYGTPESIVAYANTLILAMAVTQGYTGLTLASQIEWTDRPTVAASYQTIVSQTGTAAPAVSGSLAPLNSYAAGTTFAWARTSAGVYTLTASAAAFNTSGKTGVFVGGLNNLNGTFKSVVTSTTVITITTAVQSLATLGLLGFTATPTDALLTGTMIDVRTYA